MIRADATTGSDASLNALRKQREQIRIEESRLELTKARAVFGIDFGQRLRAAASSATLLAFSN